MYESAKRKQILSPKPESSEIGKPLLQPRVEKGETSYQKDFSGQMSIQELTQVLETLKRQTGKRR